MAHAVSYKDEKLILLKLKTESLVPNGSNLIVIAFSNQLSVSRADVARLRAAIPAHWRGELGLVAVFIKCPAIGFFFICCGFGGAICIDALSPGWCGNLSKVLAVGTLVLCFFASIWWGVGCLRKTNNLLSSNRFIAAALVYIGAIYIVMNAFDVLGPLCVEASESIVQQAAVTIDFRNGNVSAKKKWVSWKVYAMPELSRVIAVGRIGYGSTEALESVFRENPSLRLLELHSPGGLISEELKLELLVKRLRLDTVVLRNCYSACTIVFLAGERRFIGQDAEFGFHQSGYKGKPKTTEWSVNESMASILFREKGVKSDFSRVALNTPYEDLWLPHPSDVKSSGYATDWWSSRGPEYR